MGIGLIWAATLGPLAASKQVDTEGRANGTVGRLEYGREAQVEQSVN